MRFLFVAVLFVVGCALGCANAQKKAESAASDPMVLIAKAEQERASSSSFSPYLANKDAKVRARAALALARLEMIGALDPLLGAMKDADASVRASAAFGVGQMDLAVDPKVSSEEGVRKKAEAALVDALAKERDPKVRAAIVRALGRVSDGPGIDALIALSTTAERKDSLLALGVNGKRRAARSKDNAQLAAAVDAALKNGDDATKAGAAYAAFQNKMKINLDAAKAGLTSSDAQVRIFLARAAPNQDDATAQAIVDAGLSDPDWRVRAEALRAAAQRPTSTNAIAGALDNSIAALAAGQKAQAHVVRAACQALADSGAGPLVAKPVLEKALVTLAKTSDHRGEACACAVALDIVDASSKSVERCDVDAGDAQIDRLRVAVVAGARTSSREKVQALAPFLKNDDLKVRMAAADALTALDNKEAADLAAQRLTEEDDYGVASTLLENGPLASNSDAISDSLLYKLSERFKTGKSFEYVEPLVTVAELARARTTSSARAVVAALQGHSEPRVKDAANGVPAGERGPGPRAAVIAAPASLPLSAVVRTSRGNITIVFDRERAASTVANFASLAKAKFYDGTPFHRVIADFVAQGGDKRGDGAGGPGYTIDDENSDESFTRGAVGIATAGKDTGGSQFFFCHSWQPHLDGRYTLFARVSEGLDVMDALQPDDKIVGVDIR
jgi:cyclophilin family peptidyl-prolyl cis-trans isomerase/HEAT repeat protein